MNLEKIVRQLTKSYVLNYTEIRTNNELELQNPKV